MSEKVKWGEKKRGEETRRGEEARSTGEVSLTLSLHIKFTLCPRSNTHCRLAAQSGPRRKRGVCGGEGGFLSAGQCHYLSSIGQECWISQAAALLQALTQSSSRLSATASYLRNTVHRYIYYICHCQRICVCHTQGHERKCKLLFALYA